MLHTACTNNELERAEERDKCGMEKGGGGGGSSAVVTFLKTSVYRYLSTTPKQPPKAFPAVLF